MKVQKCNTASRLCPAFDERFCTCGLGFPVEVMERKVVFGVEMRYYRSKGQCTKPKTLREYIKMKLG